MLRFDRKQQNSVKQLSFSKKNKQIKLLYSKETINKTKRQSMEWEKYLYIWQEVNIQNIYNWVEREVGEGDQDGEYM